MRRDTATRGFLYIVAGASQYYRQCERSIASLRAVGNREPIHVWAESPSALGLPAQTSNGVTVFPAPRGLGKGFELSRRLKTRLPELSPFEQTLFLDTDTTVQRPIREAWSFLASAPVAMARDINPTFEALLKQALHSRIHSYEELILTGNRCGLQWPQFNGGVIAFRKDLQTDTLFSHWAKEWERFGQRDQLALMRAQVVTGVPMAELPIEFNAWSRDQPDCPPVIIYHYWPAKENRSHRFWKSLVAVLKACLPPAWYRTAKALWRKSRKTQSDDDRRTALVAHSERRFPLPDEF